MGLVAQLMGCVVPSKVLTRWATQMYMVKLRGGAQECPRILELDLTPLRSVTVNAMISRRFIMAARLPEYFLV